MLDRIILTIAGLFLALSAHAGPLGDAAKSGDAEMVEQLLADGADINEADNFGTALHWAAMNGHTDIVILLASSGADLGAKSDMAGTPLHSATTRNNLEAIAVLLEKGAAVDSLDKANRTPLHIAAKYGNAESAKLLIDAGADVHFVRADPGADAYRLGEQTPLHVALHGERADVAALLRSAGATPMPVPPAAEALAGADVESGRKLATAYCKTCHSIEAGDPVPAAYDRGPSLIGIYGQDVARDAEFEYSQALRDFGGAWTDDRLYAYIYRPMLTVPGTLMGHQLLQKPQETADITVFLTSLAQ